MPKAHTVSLADAAEIIGESRDYVLRLANDGELTALPRNRFYVAELRAYASRPAVPNMRRRVARC